MTGSIETKQNTYLWTIDDRGVNILPENASGGVNKHTNLSSQAVSGGEVWFNSDGSVTINAGSGRFEDEAGLTSEQWEASVRVWEGLGYQVDALPLGERQR